nr:hypothetical protein Itr_chr07CG07970 [Ipomoea trifida]
MAVKRCSQMAVKGCSQMVVKGCNQMAIKGCRQMAGISGKSEKQLGAKQYKKEAIMKRKASISSPQSLFGELVCGLVVAGEISFDGFSSVINSWAIATYAD